MTLSDQADFNKTMGRRIALDGLGRNARYAMSERAGTILWLDAWDILQGGALMPPEVADDDGDDVGCPHG